MKLVVFNDRESELIFDCLSVIKKNRMEEVEERIKANINSLVELAKSISQYPSIIATTDLCGVTRSVESLMDLLKQKEGLDKILYTPTKAVLSKGFLIAKISFFNMLKIIANETVELYDRAAPISEIVKNTIFTLMGEEVFLAIIENRDSPETVRNRAGFLLANVWEYRLNEGVDDFAPTLISMWEERKKLIPIFGTMMGTAELMTISKNIDPLWIEFMTEGHVDDDVIQSIEEFLFTLTYEELLDLRKKMKEVGITAVNREKVDVLIGKKKLYEEFDSADSREMYRFFRSRKFNASFRRLADMPGPRKTIEEHIMGYRLSANKWIPHQA